MSVPQSPIFILRKLESAVRGPENPSRLAAEHAIVGKVMSRRRSLEILTVTIEAFKAIRGTLSLGSVAFEAGPPSAAKEGPLSVDPVAVTRSHHQEYPSSNPLSSTIQPCQSALVSRFEETAMGSMTWAERMRSALGAWLICTRLTAGSARGPTSVELSTSG
jgi:hypothetical protein